MGAYVNFLDSLEFDDETKASISRRTAARLLRIPIDDLRQGTSQSDPGHGLGPKA